MNIYKLLNYNKKRKRRLSLKVLFVCLSVLAITTYLSSPSEALSSYTQTKSETINSGIGISSGSSNPGNVNEGNGNGGTGNSGNGNEANGDGGTGNSGNGNEGNENGGTGNSENGNEGNGNGETGNSGNGDHGDWDKSSLKFTGEVGSDTNNCNTTIFAYIKNGDDSEPMLEESYAEVYNTSDLSNPLATITIKKLESGESYKLEYQVKDSGEYKFRAYQHEDHPGTPGEEPDLWSESINVVVGECGDPTDPEDPADPEDPTDPEDPADPEDPTDPEDPADPEDPTDPEDPADPEDPTDPEDPVDPEDPTDPEDPVDPEDPTDPEDPVDPEDPTDPEDPVDPENPTTPDEDTGDTDDRPEKDVKDAVSDPVDDSIEGNELPDTATNSYNMLILGSLLLFAGFISSLLFTKRRTV